MADRKPMADDEFQGVVSAALGDAVEFVDSTLATERAQALEYYLGKPFGDEVDGRSKVVVTTVRDTIESMLPSLLRIFCSSERVVEFAPHGSEDVEAAEQATDYVNWIFHTDNPGFSILLTWLKDGLLAKTGVVKFWWEEKEEASTSQYTGLDDEAYFLVASEAGAEVVKHEVYPAPGAQPGQDGAAPQLHDVEVTRRTKKGRVVIAAMPPEEFIIDRAARDLEGATLVGHRREVTISDLVAMGYDPDELEGLGGTGSDAGLSGSEEAQVRRPNSEDAGEASADPSQRKVTYTEAYLRVDRDGDGIAELRMVCTAGPSHTLLKDEPADHVPFADWCPVPLSHAFFGLSIADLTMDLQRINSVIMRQTLDNLVLSNNPRVAVVEDDVNMDDVLNNELGAVIRTRQPGAYQAVGVPFVAGQSLPVLEYLNSVKEDRTGLSRASMGLDPDSLQSTTRAAVAATISASQGKTEMLARVFAETGLKKLFRGVLRLICRHQDRERVIRLRGKWVAVDPRAWNAEMDVTVSVGLGRGSDAERLQALMQIKATQEGIIAKYGPNNPLVTVAQYRATLAAILEIAGFKDAGRFFLDPAQQPEQPPQPPAPDPKLLEAQARLQIEQQKAQADLELQRMRLEAENALKREAMLLEHQRKMDQMRAELELRERQMVAEAALVQRAAAVGEGKPGMMDRVEMGGEMG
ncbi:portal protein [Azospirillum soli]|uniref:portal protein n=1 Tax=Azospirillum soli TaxID=1304799 RepID=UPI001AE97BBA|nr:hypothetical protein [Azospirillum soli]MBP2311893.1 hypothetical protein [Azospirillum soli]